MKVTVILTSYNEYHSIAKAISQIAKNDIKDLELLVVAPDEKTIEVAKKELAKHPQLKASKIIKDAGTGKPNAINTAIPQAKGEIIIFTDGDMYISDNAIFLLLEGFTDEKVAGVSGHPVSLDDRNTFWGFSSHLFCYGAHTVRVALQKEGLPRKKKGYPPMSGYLYAIKMTKAVAKLFPLPTEIRAEDAYISKRINELGYKTTYSPDALAYVRFPKNLHDWIDQKKRSLGGNIQIRIRATLQKEGLPLFRRGIIQDTSGFFIPIKFASSPKEYFYLFGIYPLRLYLWILIYIQHYKKDYSNGRWEQIKSSKI
ncbi:hypothetical protein CO058_02500 [candidate division WWE3 bacterium CG_4_9_14_0_2_um_filter_35_11]|uniref:Glycosyltransferase 2-like domain-containing protein n=1 Tax=candidate division WWE3 bacterium CG_4_9_14_0_2_um_filter_35_11 TaxID=1975077 RepID=A0A2M8ELL3_UNCKA|nr:MAG: hypothetical protein COV25_02760 [candidate division WWE3 bacterium CG10_big_fil_rev_8_21_14_0_10_35_32]PJC23605.1 MAG: hypothetical protein CO058_02500 [candidate division WWE3 bacterium CG_4_9_14_0_2_um_filter_35_11]